MSMTVTVQMAEINDAAVAERAFRRRFNNTQVSGNMLSASIPGRDGDTFGMWVRLDLTNFKLSYDSDHGVGLRDRVMEAYRAEKVIQAAEDMGLCWEEYRNEDRELVLEVQYG